MKSKIFLLELLINSKWFSVLMLVTIISIYSLTLSCQRPNNFSVLQFNTWLEGTQVENGIAKISAIIETTGADIITFSEVRNYNNEDWTEKILNQLNALGIAYYGKYIQGDVSVISKFEILDTYVIFDEFESSDSGSIIAYLLNVNGDNIWIATGHLDYKHYGLYLPRGYNGGDPDWNIIEDDNGNRMPVQNINKITTYDDKSLRDEAIKALIDFANMNQHTPIIFGVDLNGASHLDWTERAKNLYDHHGLVIPWQNTKSLDENGFKDSYRELFSNEIDYPGITWPAKATEYDGTISWTPKADERDRIDFIFYKSDTFRPVGATLVGPRQSFRYGEVVESSSKDNYKDESIAWPSDHQAILVEFQNK